MKVKFVKAAFLVPVDYEPDFSEMSLQKRPDYKDNVQGKSTEYDPKTASGLDKWGYNDSPMNKEKVKENMLKNSANDIKRLERG